MLVLFFVFHKLQRGSRFSYKIPGYLQGSRSQNIFQIVQWFQRAMVTQNILHQRWSRVENYGWFHTPPQLPTPPPNPIPIMADVICERFNPLVLAKIISTCG